MVQQGPISEPLYEFGLGRERIQTFQLVVTVSTQDLQPAYFRLASNPRDLTGSMDCDTSPVTGSGQSIALSEDEGSPKQSGHHLSPTDWDFYGIDLEVEDLTNYEIGGYHPVHIGDTFDDRYKVIHKLGYGGSETVWLARDNSLHRYVALKVLCVDLSDECHDVEMSKHLKNKNSDHPGRQYIALLLDHFEINGPNGKHLCLVSEVLGPTISRLANLDKQLHGSVARKVARQFVEAVAFLHSVGVCHGGEESPSRIPISEANYEARLDHREPRPQTCEHRFVVRRRHL